MSKKDQNNIKDDETPPVGDDEVCDCGCQDGDGGGGDKGTYVEMQVQKPFWKEFLCSFDITSIAMFILYVVSAGKLLGPELALILGVVYLNRGAGALWGVRLCDVPYTKMRFIPFLGGFLEKVYVHFRRWDEAVCALAPLTWMLVTGLLAFFAYLVTGNLSCLMYAWISFAITIVDVVPIVSGLSGATVVKAVAFSISRTIGLCFMGINALLLPCILAAVMHLRDGNQAEYLGLIPLLVDGLQRFSEEYYRVSPIQAMNKKQYKVISGIYLFVLACFLILPKGLGISAISSASIPMLLPAIVIGITGLLLGPVLRSNIAALNTLRLKLCNN